MKLQSYGAAIAIGAATVTAEIFPAQKGSPALDSRELSLKGRNVLARQNFEYCDSSGYYYCDTPGGCCGITVFSCLPSGGECCSGLSEYGLDLWCPSGSSCTIQGGYVQCQDGNGDYVSADSSGIAQPTSSAVDPSATDSSDEPTATDPPDSGSSNNKPGSSGKTSGGKKKISAAVIGGAVAGPLILAIIIAAVVFFLCVKKKNKAKAQANANAAIMANQNAGGQPGQPAMSSGPTPTPTGGGPGGYYQTVNQDSKTPAYTQQYDVPTPIASPPPQWTPANQNQNQGNIAPSPMSQNAQPYNGGAQAPVSPPQQNIQPYNGGTPTPVSPINTGNGASYVQPMYQPQPVRGDAVELPLASQPNNQPLIRNGAHEMQ